METNFNVTPTTEDGKTVAIVGYITLIGWLIAYFAMHKDKKTELGSYHLRQTLLLYLIGIGVNIVARILLIVTLSGAVVMLFNLIYLVLFVLWIIGLIGAINGQKKPIPLIGDKAQSMFPGI